MDLIVRRDACITDKTVGGRRWIGGLPFCHDFLSRDFTVLCTDKECMRKRTFVMSDARRAPCQKSAQSLYIPKYLYLLGYEMTEWKVEFHPRFQDEIADLPKEARVELLAHLVVLRQKDFASGDRRSIRSKVPSTRT
jgi:hypothetical protein